MNKQHRRFAQLVKPYGLTLVHRNKIISVTDQQGHHLATLNLTPNCPYAYENTLRLLAKKKLIPQQHYRLR